MVKAVMPRPSGLRWDRPAQTCHCLVLPQYQLGVVRSMTPCPYGAEWLNSSSFVHLSLPVPPRESLPLSWRAKGWLSVRAHKGTVVVTLVVGRNLSRLDRLSAVRFLRVGTFLSETDNGVLFPSLLRDVRPRSRPELEQLLADDVRGGE